MKFYDSLLLVSRAYEDSTQQLDNRKDALKMRFENYYDSFLTTLNVDDTSGKRLLRAVDKKLTPKEIEGVKDYLAVLNNEENIAAHKMAVNFPELRTNITHLKVEYYQILNKYIEQCLEVLMEAKVFRNDNPKLDDLIGRIEEYLEKTKEEMETTLT